MPRWYDGRLRIPAKNISHTAQTHSGVEGGGKANNNSWTYLIQKIEQKQSPEIKQLEIYDLSQFVERTQPIPTGEINPQETDPREYADDTILYLNTTNPK